MSSHKRNHKRIITLWVLSVMAIPIAFLSSFRVDALQILDRSVAISTAVPSAPTTQIYRFTVPSTIATGSLVFEYCTNSPLPVNPCVAPAGFDVSSAVIQSQTTNVGYSVSVPDTTANRLVMTRPPVAGVIGVSTYTLNSIINPSTANQTVFVRISSHASTDGSGASIDEGTVAYSTGITAFGVGAYVPPYLTFCVGQTVSVDCSATGSSLASFGELRPTTPSSVTIQFSAATNDFSGYNVYMGGQTLTAGNSIIPPLGASSGSSTGVSQFGANLRGNSSPTVGSDVSGPGTGLVDANYNSPNTFRFVDGERIAYSPISSDYSRFTISYIANVSEDQPAGFYATTLTYSAIATF